MLNLSQLVINHQSTIIQIINDKKKKTIISYQKPSFWDILGKL